MSKKIFSLFFILILIAPALVWMAAGPFSGNRGDPSPEAFPRPYGWALLKNDYYRALDRYLNDHFVLRDRIVVAKNWIDLKIFGRTDHPAIHVGREGWLFRRKDVQDRLGKDHGDLGIAARRLLELHALEKVTRASGRRFRFLVVPNKAAVYPEYLGWVSFPAGGGGSVYDSLREAHRAYPLSSWLPLEGLILANKFGSHLLYDPTGIYWNGHGAALAAETLRRDLLSADAALPVMTAAGRPDDLAGRLFGRAPPLPATAMRRLAGAHAQGLGRLLVYGDGGLERLLPYLRQMARQVDVVSSGTIPTEAVREDWRPYDGILIQTSASGIRDLRIDLDPIFDQLAAEAGPAFRVPVDLAAVRPLAQIALNPAEGGLEIKSLGTQSAFVLVDLPGSYQRCFRVLRLNLTARQPDTMTVTYPAKPSFRVAKSLPPGRFNLYLPLPARSRPALWVQPGTRAGLLVLHAAEIIGFPQDEHACGRPPRRDKPDRVADGPPALPAKPNQEGGEGPGAAPAESAGKPLGPAFPAVVDASRDEKKPDRADASAAPPSAAVTASNRPDPHEGPRPEQAADEDIPSAAGNPVAQTPAPSEDVAPRIVLNDFADGRIFQRQGRQADIIVSGAYTGTVTGIEARVIRHESGEPVVPWTVIDDAPANGVFLGLLPGVPEGGWYRLEVRAAGAPGILSTGASRWGIGILVACIGQSNMKEWFHSGTDLQAHPLLRRFDADGWHEPGTRGNGAIACGNRIIAFTGLPVGLLDYAVNGSGLVRRADWGKGYWRDSRPGSIYRRFVDGVAATGGSLEFVIFIQGEADAARGVVTRMEYQAGLRRFITRQVRRDIGNASARAQLPFLVVGMVKRPGGLDEPHQAIREAQWEVADRVLECYLAATTLDLPNLGKQHLTPAAYTRMGLRVAQTVLYVLGRVGFYRGPAVAAVGSFDARGLEVTLTHRGGTDIAPSSGITGWAVADAQGVAPIQKVFRQGPRTIRILLDRPLEGRTEVRYLYGALPDTRRPLRDNASPSLPLEAFRGWVAPLAKTSAKAAPDPSTP